MSCYGSRMTLLEQALLTIKVLEEENRKLQQALESKCG